MGERIMEKYQREFEVAKKASYEAADAIMKIYREGFEVEIKSDNSPVTLADKTSDQILRSSLEKNFPYAFLTEEEEDDKSRLRADYVWIIDPLDGTKDFVDHDDEFAINVALVYQHEPVLGLVLIPATDELYFAIKGEGAYYMKNRDDSPKRISVNQKKENLTLLSSVYHSNTDEKALAGEFSSHIATTRHVGSAIKACLIARGEAEVSFRFNPNTKEWDTCAPQIVVSEAGGFFTEPDGTPIHYNREDVYNRNGFSIYDIEENNFSKQYLLAKKHH